MSTSTPRNTPEKKAVLAKTSSRLAAAFEAFLSTAKAQRFRQSDVAAVLYPLTRPRGRATASDAAASLIHAAAKAGRLERTGHLHWMVRPANVTRTLRDGRKVHETPGLVKLTLNTRCPAKWVAVDLETGELWEGSATGWVRASEAAAAAVAAIRAKPSHIDSPRRGRKSAHEAAAHDELFRAQVGEAICEADDPKSAPSIPHEVAKAQMAKQRAALKARIAKAAQ